MAERTPEQQAALIAWAEVTLGQLGIDPDCDPEELELYLRALRYISLSDVQVQQYQKVFARCRKVTEAANQVRTAAKYYRSAMQLLWHLGHERFTLQRLGKTHFVIVTLSHWQRLSSIQGLSQAIGKELPFEEVVAYVDRVPSVLARCLNTDDPAERTSPIVIPFAGGSFIFEKEEGDGSDMRLRVWRPGHPSFKLPRFTRIVRSI